MPENHKIQTLFLSQEDLILSGCLDLEMPMIAYGEGGVLFPEKIVQIFSEENQERINCLPATFV